MMKVYRTNFPFRYIGFWFLMILLLIVFVFTQSDSIFLKAISGLFLFGVVFIFVILPLVAIILLYGFKNRCPRCGKLFAKKHDKSEIVFEETKKEQKIIKQHMYDDKGNIKQTVETPEDVKVKISKINHTFRCRKCNHKWYESEVKREKK